MLPAGWKGEPGAWLPSGRNIVTLPWWGFEVRPIDHDVIDVGQPASQFQFQKMQFNAQRQGTPPVFVTHALPLLSIAMPLPLAPALNTSTLPGRSPESG